MSVSANQGSGENIMYIFFANQKNLEVCFSQKDHVNFLDYQKKFRCLSANQGSGEKITHIFSQSEKFGCLYQPIRAQKNILMYTVQS